MGWLLVTLGVAFGSAIVPLISVEVFLVGLCASQAAPHWQAFDCYVAAIMAETCPNRIYQHAVIVDASYYMCVK